MQQLLSAFGIDWHLLGAQAVNFAIVLIALWYFLYKPVLKVMARRQEMLTKGVADAKQAEEMLAGADNEAIRRVAVAEGEAETIVARARETANVEKVRLLKDAEARAVLVAQDALARATEVAARARRESERDVARLSILAAEKILKEHYDR
jgi:F-type H+-transporting ATPase subunit b